LIYYSLYVHRYDINRLKNDIKVLDEEKVVSTVQYDTIIATLKSEIINKQIENEEKMNNISTECSKIVYILDCLDNTVTQNSASLPKTSIGLLSNLRSRIQSIASLSSTTDSVDKMNSNREYITDNSTDNSNNIKLVEICQALENENIEAYKNISALNIELKKTKQALESEMQVTKLIPQYRLGMVKIRNQIKEIYDQLNTEKLGNSTLQSQLKTLTNELNFYKEKHANDFIGNRRNNSILSKIQEREKEVIRIDEEIEKLKGEIEKKAKFTTMQLLMELINI
jgi:hypothetical protein